MTASASPPEVRQSPCLSVVVPVYRERDSLDELYRRTMAALSSMPEPPMVEMIFVSDGSTDGSVDVIRALCSQDDRVKLVELSRNFGHQIAVTAGLDHANGDAAVVIDADLQDPPEVIPRMVQAWRNGADVAYGVRTVRHGESVAKRATAKLFYRLLRWLSDAELPLDSADFRLIGKPVLDVLAQAREEGRYLRGLVAWAGFSQVAIPYERDPRGAGESGYTLSKLLRLASSGIVGFSERPLRMTLQVGFVITLSASLFSFWIVIWRLLNPNADPGFAALMVAVLFLGGVQMLFLGVVGAYVGQILREVRGRPLYVVRSWYGSTASHANVGETEAGR